VSIDNNAPAPPPINWSAGVQQKLIGLRPWLAGAAQEGYTIEHIENKVIPAAIREFERYCNIRINLCQIVTRPDGTYTGTVQLPANPASPSMLTTYTVPCVLRDGMMLRTQDLNEFFATRLYEHPVQMVQRIRIMLNDQNVYQMPTQWINIEQRTGKLHLLPIYGPLLATNVLNLFQLNVSMQDKDYAPNTLCIDYVAGLIPGWQDDYEYADLRRALEQFAAMMVLDDVRELADAGLSAVGNDGESRQYTRFEDMRKSLQVKVDTFKELWNAQESPMLIGWV
jgi:hypothetical protein